MPRQDTPETEPDELAELSIKEKVFVLKMLETMNTREAAKAAGYSLNYGYAILEKRHVKKAVNGLLSDRLMDVTEALARLSAMARADIRDVLSERPKRDLNGNVILDENGEPEMECVIDLQKAIDEGNSFLIKEVGHTHEGFKVKLHDAQKALITILKLHGAFDSSFHPDTAEAFRKSVGDLEAVLALRGREN